MDVTLLLNTNIINLGIICLIFNLIEFIIEILYSSKGECLNYYFSLCFDVKVIGI